MNKVTLNKENMKTCIKALIRPLKTDAEDIYNVIFLDNPTNRKTFIIEYFKRRFASDSNALRYVSLLENDNSEYEKMYLKYLETIRMHKPQNISDRVLLCLDEKKFFEAYGLAMGKCSSKKIEFDEEGKIKKNTGKRFKEGKKKCETKSANEIENEDINNEELQYNKDQVRAMKLAIDKYYSTSSIDTDSLATLLLPSVKMHSTKKYRTMKKYANQCYLKASAIKRAYKAYKGTRDTVFNNNKHIVVDDFKAIVTHEALGN